MTDRPILFSGEMVRAILAGRKSQTRRVVKPQPPYDMCRCDYSPTGWSAEDVNGRCTCNRTPPIFHGYGGPGDRLWVRETFNRLWFNAADGWQTVYRADMNNDAPADGSADSESIRWRPSIFMPRWASRITLTIADVRVERVQDISPDDCRAEGLTPDSEVSLLWRENIQDKYRDLWDSINAKRGFGWDTNPWVWVISFEVQP